MMVKIVIQTPWCFRGVGGLGVGGGLYGDASGREWEVEVGANSTGAQMTCRLGPVILKLVIESIKHS